MPALRRDHRGDDPFPFLDSHQHVEPLDVVQRLLGEGDGFAAVGGDQGAGHMLCNPGHLWIEVQAAAGVEVPLGSGLLGWHQEVQHQSHREASGDRQGEPLPPCESDGITSSLAVAILAPSEHS